MGSLDGPKTDLTEQQRESDMKETDNYSGFVVTWFKIGTQRIVFSSQVVCQDVPTCNLDTTFTWPTLTYRAWKLQDKLAVSLQSRQRLCP